MSLLLRVLIPSVRLLPVLLPKEAPLSIRLRSPEVKAIAFRPHFGIAVLTFLRHLQAAPPGVKGVPDNPGPIGQTSPGPLNRCDSHSASPSFQIILQLLKTSMRTQLRQGFG